MDPFVTGSLITAGAGVLSSSIGSRSSRDAVNANANLDKFNRQWQDANRFTNLSSTLGDDYLSGSYDRPVVYGGKGADLLGRDRDLEYSAKHMDQTFDKMSGYGLTPQEISGSPVPGGQKVSGGNNVLGNAVSSASSDVSRANAAMTQSRMQSNTQIATSKIQADAHVKGKAIEAGIDLLGQRNTADISKYSVDTSRKNVLDRLKLQDKLNSAQISKINSQKSAIMQDTDFKRILHSERWERLFSTMSAENVLASVLAVKNGLNIKEVLQGIPPANRKKLTNFIWSISASKSNARSESLGISGTISDLITIFNKHSGLANDKRNPVSKDPLLKQNEMLRKHLNKSNL